MSAIDTIKDTVAKNDVVLFMKGTKEMPQCGFSSRIAGVLNYMDVDYKDINVLADDAIRQGIKDFADWPTIPQLYVNGEFVGGCDIITEMTLSGELDALFSESNVAFDKDAADKILQRFDSEFHTILEPAGNHLRFSGSGLRDRNQYNGCDKGKNDIFPGVNEIAERRTDEVVVQYSDEIR